MTLPSHLEPLRRDIQLGTCVDCGDVTDLLVAGKGTPLWSCWRCQKLPELHLHKQCEGCRAWFVGTESRKRCGHGAGCQEAT